MRIVIRAILAIILGAIALVVLAPMLMIGGCIALIPIYGSVARIKDEQAAMALEQAKHAPLPPHVQRLIEDEYLDFSPRNDPRYGMISLRDSELPQDPSGRYMLTSEGLYDFASTRLTRLACPGLLATGGQWINFRELWLDEQFFLWGRCIYDVTTLQPGPIEDVRCGADACGGDDFAIVVAPLARQADRAYRTNYDEYLFVKLPAGAPGRVWAVSNLLDSAVQSSKLGPALLEWRRSKGQAAAFGEHSISPNAEYDASFDSTALTIKRVQNRVLVAQVNFKGSKAGPALFGRAKYILGWTGDSRQVVFLVEEDFSYDRRLAQVFTLTIP